MVFVDRLVDSGYCDGVDNREGGRLAAKALIASLAARVVRGKAGGRVGCVCVERPDGMSDRRFR